MLCAGPAPHLLPLDEPTNNLDDGVAAFLEEQIRALPGTVVVATTGPSSTPPAPTSSPLEIPATDRLPVTGGNGAGKSTLLAVLAGRLPAEGEARRRRRPTVGLLTQDTAFDRRNTRSATPTSRRWADRGSPAGRGRRTAGTSGHGPIGGLSRRHHGGPPMARDRPER